MMTNALIMNATDALCEDGFKVAKYLAEYLR